MLYQLSYLGIAASVLLGGTAERVKPGLWRTLGAMARGFRENYSLPIISSGLAGRPGTL